MGDIAEMHVAAYESGLDPNDMDGADWADFFDGQSERLSDAEHLAAMLEGWFVTDLLDHEFGSALEGEAPEDTICRLWPTVTIGQAAGFVSVLKVIGAFPAGGSNE